MIHSRPLTIPLYPAPPHPSSPSLRPTIGQARCVCHIPHTLLPLAVAALSTIRDCDAQRPLNHCRDQDFLAGGEAVDGRCGGRGGGGGGGGLAVCLGIVDVEGF